MDRLVPFASDGPSSRPFARTLPVAIFYEDIAAADRALHSVRDALRSQDDQRVIQPMLWPVQLLTEEHWRRLAAADVALADLCLVSLSREPQAAGSTAWFGELAAAESQKWITLASFAAASPASLRRAG